MEPKGARRGRRRAMAIPTAPNLTCQAPDSGAVTALHTGPGSSPRSLRPRPRFGCCELGRLLTPVAEDASRTESCPPPPPAQEGGSLKPRALEPAPCPNMGCRLHWRSPLARTTAAVCRSLLVLVRCCRRALAYCERPNQDPPSPECTGGRHRAFPSVHRTSALCLSLRYVSAQPKRASGPRPESHQPPASGDATLDGRGAVCRTGGFRAMARAGGAVLSGPRP
jgi:hypothetical protein